MTRRAPAPLLVAAGAIVALVALPLAYLVVRVAEGGDRAWRVLRSHALAELVGDTIVLVVMVTATSVVVAVLLAWLTTSTDLPWRRFWATAVALPLVIPSYVAALVFLAAFGPRGLLQRALETSVAVERVPDIYGLPGAWLALTVATYPFVFVLTAAALRDRDPALEDAARGLGQTRFQTFWRVTVPVIRPSVAAGGLLVALYTLADFGVVSLMQYDSLTRAIYLQYRALFDRTPAAVLALILVALSIVVLTLELRSRGRLVSRGTGRGTARRAPATPLGRWRLPAVGFCTLVVGVALVVPVAVLGYWATRAVRGDERVGWSWEPAVNSAGVSLIAASAAVIASLPVAVLAARYPTPLSRGLERLAYTGNALPGIVIALSLVFFAANYATPVYQTVVLLVFAYVVRFFPQALAGSHAAVARVDPRLEEAGRSLGRGPAAVFARITTPLVTPGLLAGAALVFLSTMKELPATLLLRPIGFETLATEIWRYTSVGAYSRAALPALLLIALSAPLLWLVRAGTAADAGTPG